MGPRAWIGGRKETSSGSSRDVAKGQGAHNGVEMDGTAEGWVIAGLHGRSMLKQVVLVAPP